ncbi:MAG: cytochrome b/b6 domain-containing protein, partial [Xanthobacteraceae bacterium]
MTRRVARIRKTDYGTIVLHWSLVAALVVAILTGLRIATEVPDRTWINMLDAVLPTSTVWSGHIPAAVVLVTVSIAYAVYMRLSGLGHRIRLDRARLAGLFGSRQMRWGAVNVLLYWLFYAVLLAELSTGIALYLGSASSTLVDIHWLGMWVILGYAALHVLAHIALGGQQQLLRLFRPARIMPVPPPFDPADLLALLDRPGSSPAAARRTPAAPPRRRPLLRSVPFVGAVGLAVVGVTILVAVERQTEDRLVIRRIG